VRLEKYQRNAIFQEIVAGGLDPNECNLTGGDQEVSISHVPSGWYFILGGDARGYSGSYGVGDSTISWPYDASMWAKVPEKVRRWAEDVKHDVNTPDLWAELQRQREILTGARYEAVENTLFTPAEQTEIAKQLQEIKEYVKKTYSLSSQQMSRVEARLDEAKEASHRIGRKDWLLLFFGVTFTVIATDFLPPEAVQHILIMALRGLDHLFGGGGGLPQLPPMP
jgi:hypothetical protein